MIKTTQISDLPWSAIFSVIVYSNVLRETSFDENFFSDERNAWVEIRLEVSDKFTLILKLNSEAEIHTLSLNR